MRGSAAFLAGALLAVVTAASASAQTYSVGKPTCRPDDRVETGLQGQVPVADRLSGAAAPGYWCNLTEIGAIGSTASDPAHSKLSGWANFDTYRHCAYFHDGNDGNNGGGGTVVLDVSDPRNPKQTAYLTTGAMTGAWESLRVNARRGLLVADHQPSSLTNGPAGDAPGTSPLDVYDVSKDCTKPELLFSGSMPNAVGHEGWFQPDGMVYYVSGGGTVVPVDLSDPRHPKELGVLDIGAHGGSTSDDGTRAYMCVGSAVGIYDTTEVAARRPNPQVTELAMIELPAAVACQETYPVTYGGRPYFLQFGELGEIGPLGGSACGQVQTSSFARINFVDIADERDPKLVATLMNEVALPENCDAVAADTVVDNNPNGGPVSAIFLYGTHMCHPDRLHDPTLLACAEFFSGVRVYDIRDPLKAREIAYYNAGSLAVGDPKLDMAASRPVIRPDLGQIWYDGLSEGFHVLQFAPGVYPFAESMRCPSRPDWFVAHYNLALDCEAAPPSVAPPSSCRRTLRVSLRRLVGARKLRRLRRATVYLDGRRVRTLRGRALRRRVRLRTDAPARLRVVGRSRKGRRIVAARRVSCPRRSDT